MISAHQWKKVVRPLLDDPSGWSWRNKLTYRTPVDWVVLGVTAEGSGFSPGRVYVSELHMPLFVPAETVWLNHSARVPNGTHPVGLDDKADFTATVRLALARVPSQEEALSMIAKTSTEESAYALLLLGRADLAERRLAEPYHPKDDRPFVEEARQRRAEVAQLLRTEGSGVATALLRSWRDATVAKVKLAP